MHLEASDPSFPAVVPAVRGAQADGRGSRPLDSTISRFRKITERGLARMLFAEALPAVGGEGHAGEEGNAATGTGR